MKRKSLLIIGSATVILVAGTLAYRALASSRAGQAAEVQTAAVQRGALSATLSSSGNVRSGQTATITWQTSGKVGAITLQPGDVVEEDQVLAALDANTLNADTIQARQELIAAQQKLDDLLNSRLQQAQALQAVAEAQQALDSLQADAAEQASRAQLALAQAQEALAAAQKKRQKMDYPHSSDKLVIEKAETDYLLAKQAYKEALKAYQLVDQKNLTNPERVQALNRLVTAEANMKSKLATYNWYRLDYSENDIAQADAELAVAQAGLASAQAAYERLKAGASTAELALAEATLSDAQRGWERVKEGASATDIAAAQAAVDAAQATLDYAELLAPFAGTITEVAVSTGDLVRPGDTAFRLDDLATLYVDLQVSEVDLASLAVGQAATLEFDALPDEGYAGEVSEIGLIGTNSQGVVNYPVTVRITAADASIRPGMTASVTIVVAQVADVLLVPNKAIRTSGGQKSVTVLFEGQQISVPVTVGLVGDALTEVTSEQLREGDTVVINGSTSSTTTTTNQNQNMPGGIMGGMGEPPAGGGGPAGGMP